MHTLDNERIAAAKKVIAETDKLVASIRQQVYNMTKHTRSSVMDTPAQPVTHCGKPAHSTSQHVGNLSACAITTFITDYDYAFTPVTRECIEAFAADQWLEDYLAQ